MTAEKEKSAEIVKSEVRIIWGDYFKAPHLKYHEIHALTHEIMTLASSASKMSIKRPRELW